MANKTKLFSMFLAYFCVENTSSFVALPLSFKILEQKLKFTVTIFSQGYILISWLLIIKILVFKSVL
jgi:hypothetical protein